MVLFVTGLTGIWMSGRWLWSDYVDVSDVLVIVRVRVSEEIYDPGPRIFTTPEGATDPPRARAT